MSSVTSSWSLPGVGLPPSTATTLGVTEGWPKFCVQALMSDCLNASNSISPTVWPEPV
jgi:hypothetical protein